MVSGRELMRLSREEAEAAVIQSSDRCHRRFEEQSFVLSDTQIVLDEYCSDNTCSEWHRIYVVELVDDKAVAKLIYTSAYNMHCCSIEILSAAVKSGEVVIE